MERDYATNPGDCPAEETPNGAVWGYACTLDKGHEGDHQAHGQEPGSEPLHTWANPEAEITRLRALNAELVEALEDHGEWRDLVKQNYPEMLRPYESGRALLARVREATP